MKNLINKRIKHQILKLDILLNISSNNIWKLNYYAVSGSWNKKPLLNIDTIVNSLNKIQILIYKIFENKGNIVVLNQWADVKDIYQKLFFKYPISYLSSWIPGQVSNFYQNEKPSLNNNLVVPSQIDLIFNLDLKLTNTAVNEIKNERIVFISLVKTHSRSKNITYKIPCNNENLRSSLFFSLFLNKILSKQVILKNSLKKKNYLVATLLARKILIKQKKFKKILDFFKRRKKALSIRSKIPLSLDIFVRFNKLKLLRLEGAAWLRKIKYWWVLPGFRKKIWKTRREQNNDYFKELAKKCKKLFNKTKKKLK